MVLHPHTRTTHRIWFMCRTTSEIVAVSCMMEECKYYHVTAAGGGGGGGAADRVAVGDEVAGVEVHHDHAPGPPRPSQHVIRHVPVWRYL